MDGMTDFYEGGMLDLPISRPEPCKLRENMLANKKQFDHVFKAFVMLLLSALPPRFVECQVLQFYVLESVSTRPVLGESWCSRDMSCSCCSFS